MKKYIQLSLVKHSESGGNLKCSDNAIYFLDRQLEPHHTFMFILHLSIVKKLGFVYLVSGHFLDGWAEVCSYFGGIKIYSSENLPLNCCQHCLLFINSC